MKNNGTPRDMPYYTLFSSTGSINKQVLTEVPEEGRYCKMLLTVNHL